jgi:SNF2 family DNA or RNA helicase
MITRLRQICCHPGVFVDGYTGGSGKMELLEELLEELIEGEHRILLFSQFTTLLEIIKSRLEEKNIKYLYLDGTVPSYKRKNIVDNFNEGEGSVFLISLKAGGTGLNLTSADCVIHFDPWWNPAVEDQASDRAHRIGQENVVEVFKLITKDTIEEKIFELQIKKRKLIDSVIQEGETFISKLSKDEIMELFQV